MTPRQETRDQYRAHIEKQKHSGLSIADYCRANDLPSGKFNYHRTAMATGKKSSHGKFVQVPNEGEVKYEVNIGKATFKIPSSQLRNFLKEIEND